MDQTGCGNYRVRWPALELEKKGVKVKLIGVGEDAGLTARLDHNREVTGVTIPDDCDVVVMQRPSNEVLSETVPFVRAQGVRVVIDVDDDLAMLSPRHVGWAYMHNKTDTGQSWAAVTKACKEADLVVASTPALLSKYAAHGRGALLRNCLPDSFFEAELVEEKGEPHVGWGGAILSHPDDLSVLGPALAQLRCKAKIVGPVPIDPITRLEVPERARRLLGVDVEFTGSIPFDQWIPAISQIHVGIAPLEMSAFNIAKSWLKPLEYSVARVPFVCTPTPEYQQLGAGLLAQKPKQWKSQLAKLLNDETFRKDEIERNYEIATKWKMSGHAGEWGDAWLG